MKKLISLLLALCVVFSFSITCFADGILPESPTSQSESEIEPRAEETEWFYCTADGYIWKRLWSYTRGIWLTDYILVGPIPEDW